ncbi:sugar ABC transporter substrate-binding protein [Limnochorda pilosa]|uniref:sugar ABC transporter substrate-binding protein n=1 Tax=Limnochorda pilosa TaxID=1555112 RepID=UPI0026E962C3|nr:substrate-binding domain-containing protein [Limnochorda pilosa]
MKRFALGIALCTALLIFLGSVVPALAANDKITIGVSIRSLSEERWARERDMMAEKAKELGVDIIFTDANNDEFVQNSQIENLIARGVDVIIIIARNSDTAAAAVEMASSEGIPTIAYDVAIYHPDAIYVSFDSVRVGAEMARAIVERVPTGRYFWLGGSPTDDNAYLVRQGHFQVLQPLIDSGAIELIGEQWCDAWSPEQALKHTENALTAHGNRIDAIIASNDGTAGGAIQALAEQGLAGLVAVSGQDADLVACQRIAEGTQTVTIFKDVRLLVEAGMQAAVELARGQRPSGVNGKYVNEAKGIEQDAIYVDVIPVTQENLYEVIVKSGFHRLEDVYRNVPRDQWPTD